MLPFKNDNVVQIDRDGRDVSVDSPVSAQVPRRDSASGDKRWVRLADDASSTDTPLPVLLRNAKRTGMLTSVLTRGLCLAPERLDEIRAVTDFVLVVIGGRPERHNRLCGDTRSFDRMTMALPELRVREIDFGFLFTLDRGNLADLPWVAEFAANVGAGQLQVAISRPLRQRLGVGHLRQLHELLQRRYAGRMTVRQVFALPRDDNPSSVPMP